MSYPTLKRSDSDIKNGYYFSHTTRFSHNLFFFPQILFDRFIESEQQFGYRIQIVLKLLMSIQIL